MAQMMDQLLKWVRPLAAPEDRVLLALCVLVLGYVVLGAVVAHSKASSARQ